MLDKFHADQSPRTCFDRSSITLFFSPVSRVKTGVGTPPNDGLSAVDRSFVSSARAYAMTEPIVEAALEVNVNVALSGKPGQKDPQFTAATGSSYIVDTAVNSELVKELFGPNSQTPGIAEDDGRGTGTRIVANLGPGLNFVQVRYDNSGGGTGNYAVKVQRPAA